MLLKSAKISNFKSIGTENNVLYVEDSVTALIGKNESGKSNVLESLGLVNLWAPLSADYLKKCTHGQSASPGISLMFCFSTQDKELFPSAEGTTTLVYTGTDVTIDGGLSDLISQDAELNAHIATLQTTAKSNELKLDNSKITALRTHIAKLATISKKVYSTIFSELDAAKGDIRVSKEECKDVCMELVDKIKTIILRYYNLIPQTYYRRSDAVLKDAYTFDEIKKIYEENKTTVASNNVFFNLMYAAGVDQATLFSAFEAPTAPAQHTFERKVAGKIDALVEEFNDFYRQEEISLEFNISSKTARLFISTSDMYMSFSERSNGLKWYFSLFVDVKARTSAARPIMYLLDEPGVYLHVRAQKKLQELFAHLCEKGNQVVYTTHSPFMIDANNVFNVRAIEKGEDGLSSIFRSIYNHKLSDKSKLETLSPLIEAFGMDLKDNIGPQYEKNNVVVEGVTDCMYITAMLNYFKVDDADRPNIIPCAGVDNVNLVVSILIGWGCEYRVVVDYDNQGYTQYELIVRKSGLSDDGIVFFVNLKTANQRSDVKPPNNETTESLIASEDNDKLFNKYDGTGDTKTLAAKEFLDKVSCGEIVPSQETADNFRRLFSALGINVP